MRIVAVVACVLVGAGAASGQEAPLPASQGTRTVVLGPQYEAGGFHRFFFGDDYRALWTTPVTLPVLDLQHTDGGLTPVRRVGGEQTRGLALKGASGRSWTFRAADKDPSSILPPDLQGTIAQDIVRDQIAAGNPAAPVVADALLDAAGVMHVHTHMVVMPDDPALGQFREVFKGLPGTFEEFPNEPEPGRPGFGNAVEILGQEKFHERLRQDPTVRVDAHALLDARLMDMFIGDWDRHRRQWRWARLADKPRWQPIPEDRDQAFSRFEGLLLTIGRNTQPRFVKFDGDYPRIFGLTFNGWEHDRQLLAELDGAAWDQAARALQAKLTDAVIDGAVARLPAEFQKIEGARLAHALKSRRDRLVREAQRFYRHLAARVDVYGTDAAERFEVVHNPDGTVDVTVSAGDAPYWTRRLRPDETDEVRLYALGGDDTVVTRGTRRHILVRVVGGDGHDRIDDSAGGRTRVSDASESSDIRKGPGTRVDTRPYVPPPPNPKAPWIPPRDWSRDYLFRPWLGYGPDEGVFTGFGVTRKGYGFRKDPFASEQTLRAGFAWEAQKFKIAYDGDFRVENSGRRLLVSAYGSGIETLHFFGFGNERQPLGDDTFHRVDQQQYLFAPAMSWPLGPHVRFDTGPVVKFSKTRLAPDRFIGGILHPYGSDDFGQVGATGTLRFDTTDVPRAARRGVVVEATGNVWPSLWNVRSTFGEVHGTAGVFASAGGYLKPTLGLRAGGKKVWGDYPFLEAAFIGGSLATSEGTTVRGFTQNRFAGDASVFANAELRLFLARFVLLLPADFGVFGLGDVGRVFLEGESSKKWHPTWGGGIWLAWLKRDYTFTATIAASDEDTRFYLRGGFGF